MVYICYFCLCYSACVTFIISSLKNYYKQKLNQWPLLSDLNVFLCFGVVLRLSNKKHYICIYLLYKFLFFIFILLVFIPGYLFWLLYLFLFLLLISDNRLMSRFYGETNCRKF